MLVTRGKEGSSLFHPPQAAVHIVARARDVFGYDRGRRHSDGDVYRGATQRYLMVEAARGANMAAGIGGGQSSAQPWCCQRNCALALREEPFPGSWKLA